MLNDVFEIELLSSMVKDVDVFKKTMGVVDSTFFSSAIASDSYDIIKIFHTEYNRMPTDSELIHLYKKNRRVEDDAQVKSFISSMYTRVTDKAFVVNELTKYVKSKKLETIFKSSYEKIKLGNDVDCSTVVSDIYKIQTDSVGDKYAYGIGIEESELIEEKRRSSLIVPTNVKYLNEILGGGLSGGQLGVILAPPNYGKTMILLNFAVYAFLKRHNVLFVTLEMPEFSILRRIVMMMAGALNMEINPGVLKRITEAVQKRFVILYKPTRSIGVDFLYSVCHQSAANGTKFDAVFIDYADLLRTSSKYKEKRLELGDLFVDIKSFSQIMDVPVWTATQANRESMSAETVTMKHVSEDISKAATCDVMLSVCDKVEADRYAKLFLTKHREGRSDLQMDVFFNDHMWIKDSMENETIALQGSTPTGLIQ